MVCIVPASISPCRSAVQGGKCAPGQGVRHNFHPPLCILQQSRPHRAPLQRGSAPQHPQRLHTCLCYVSLSSSPSAISHMFLFSTTICIMVHVSICPQAWSSQN